MRTERPGPGAAVDQLQDRGLDLEVALGVQGLPQAPGHQGAGPDHVPGRLPYGQVGVALPDPDLVGQLGVQIRHRAESLGGQLPGRRQHGQLAALRADHPTGDADEVARGRRRPSRPPAAPRPPRPATASTCSRTPESFSDSPSCRVAKQSLPVLRMNTTRPVTETTVSVSSPAAARPGPRTREAVAARTLGDRAVGPREPAAPEVGRWSAAPDSASDPPSRLSSRTAWADAVDLLGAVTSSVVAGDRGEFGGRPADPGELRHSPRRTADTTLASAWSRSPGRRPGE